MNIGVSDVTRIGTQLRETMLKETELKFSIKRIIFEATKRAIRFVDQYLILTFFNLDTL